jgi:hypothetical protein
MQDCISAYRRNHPASPDIASHRCVATMKTLIILDAAAPALPLSPPPASSLGRGRAKPSCCRRQHGLLVLSRARKNVGCPLHGVGVVRPPDTIEWLLSVVRWRER